MKNRSFSKNFIRRFGAVAGSMLMLGTVACGGGTKEKEPDLPTSVWAAYGTEKILQELDYSARYSQKTLKISAFKNEYEAAQVIMTPDYDVRS